MLTTTRLAVLAATIALAGCSYNPPPIQVLPWSTDDLAALAGEWSGEYRATPTDRSGTISFRLAAGTDTAFGEVVMIPRANTGQGGIVTSMEARAGSVTRVPIPLNVSFVRVRDGYLSGALDVYVDPDLGCPVDTRFTGKLRDGVLEGTFETKDANGYLVQSGSWRVERFKP